MEMTRNLEKIIGFFLGGAIGDALGMPVEGLSKEEINNRYGSIHYFLKADERTRIRGLLPGQYTDDTQLMLATTKAIVNYNRFDVNNFVQEYLLMHKSDELRGVGSVTWSALNKLDKKVSYKHSGDDSLGSGCLTRTSPLAFLFQLYGDPHFDTIVEDAIRMTHNNNDAVRFSFIYYSLLQNVYSHDNLIDTSIMDRFIMNPKSKKHSDFINNLIAIKRIISTGEENYTLSTNVSCIDVLSAALFCFLKSPENYLHTVSRAVNLGGDTDTIAFVAGQLSGVYNGVNVIPEYLVKHLENNQNIRLIGKQFYKHIIDS